MEDERDGRRTRQQGVNVVSYITISYLSFIILLIFKGNLILLSTSGHCMRGDAIEGERDGGRTRQQGANVASFFTLQYLLMILLLTSFYDTSSSLMFEAAGTSLHRPRGNQGTIWHPLS